jgi:hypothetical protein
MTSLDEFAAELNAKIGRLLPEGGPDYAKYRRETRHKGGLGFNRKAPAVVYLSVRRENLRPTVVKVGVTGQLWIKKNKAGDSRLTNFNRSSWKLYGMRYFDLGSDAFAAEQEVIRWWRRDLWVPRINRQVAKDINMVEGKTETVLFDDLRSCDVSLDDVMDWIGGKPWSPEEDQNAV